MEDSTLRHKVKEPLRVLVTGAAGNIGYSLSFMIAQGIMFGSDQGVILNLYDKSHNLEKLKVLHMELENCSLDLMKDILISSEPSEAFRDIDYAIMCGAKPRLYGMERKDLIVANRKIFEEQGQYLNQYAKSSVKVCVVGNPANTNALILMKNAPRIDPNNFSALTRLDHNSAINQIADKLNIDNDCIKNIIIWGNHSSTQFPDIEQAYIEDNSRLVKSYIKDVIRDEKWLKEDFIRNVQQRGAAIVSTKKKLSIASAANAICDHVRKWHLGTQIGEWTSMAVLSRGEYGAPLDVMFSFPVIIKDGTWKIVEGIKLDSFSKEKITITGNELIEERDLGLIKCN
jgi:malate dehydrogenase